MMVDEADKTSKAPMLTPILVTLLAAVFGLLGTAAGAITQGWFNRQLEHDKFEFTKTIENQRNEANLILKVIETGDPEKAQRNLLFLVKAGFINDPGGKIFALANDASTAPVLPPANTSGTRSSTEDIPIRSSRDLSLGRSYSVGTGEVSLEIVVGYAHYGNYFIVLFDRDGKNPQQLARGNSADAAPDIFALGKGPDLVGKTLVVTTTVASLDVDNKTPLSVLYKLSGGKSNQNFRESGTAQGGLATYQTKILLTP